MGGVVRGHALAPSMLCCMRPGGRLTVPRVRQSQWRFLQILVPWWTYVKFIEQQTKLQVGAEARTDGKECCDVAIIIGRDGKQAER